MAESPTMKLLNKQKGKEPVEEKPVEEKANPVKKAAAKKKKVEAAPLEEVLDLIKTTVTHLENLGEEEAFQHAHDLIDAGEFNNFQLGGALAVIQANGWWKGKGYENFKVFIEGEFGIAYRKAMYLINIYTALVESGVKWEQVKDVGWTKLRVIAHLLTPENVDEWVQTAMGMTMVQLEAYVKEKNNVGGDGLDEADPKDAGTLTTITFKLHEDQKAVVKEALETVKKDFKTDFDNVALEHLSMSYIEGKTGKATSKAIPPLHKHMGDAGIEAVVDALEKAFPDATFSVEFN